MNPAEAYQFLGGIKEVREVSDDQESLNAGGTINKKDGPPSFYGTIQAKSFEYELKNWSA